MSKLLKIFVIFSFAVAFVILIYNRFSIEENEVLSIGDSLSMGKTPFNSYNKSYNYYLSRSINSYYNDSISYADLTYVELYRKIYYDDTVYNKGEFVNIKNAIGKSDTVILTANNNITFKKCEKNNRIFTEYLVETFNTITKIIDQIKNIRDIKVIVLTPYCYIYNEEINNYIEKYYVYKNVHFINLYKKIHKKYYYVPNKYNPYPSLEGYNYVYNLIRKEMQIN